MNDDKSNAWGVIIVIALVVFFGWSFISNSQEQKKSNDTATIQDAVLDINSRIDDLYSTATDTTSAIEDECSWQADELNGNIGDVCSNNTGNYALDSGSDYALDEDSYVAMLDDGTPVDDIVAELVDDANTNYEKIIDTVELMVSALNDQCSWIEDNIDDEIAWECYDAGDDFDYDGSSSRPFETYDYLEA